MFKRLLTCVSFLAILFFYSCDNSRKAAHEYSSKLTNIEDESVNIVTPLQQRLIEFQKMGQYDSVVAIGKRLEDVATTMLKRVEQITPPKAKGIDEFRSEMISYFGTIRDIYKVFQHIPLDGDSTLYAEWQTDMREASDRVERATQSVQDAQQKFAKQNGFKILPAGVN